MRPLSCSSWLHCQGLPHLSSISCGPRNAVCYQLVLQLLSQWLLSDHSSSSVNPYTAIAAIYAIKPACLSIATQATHCHWKWHADKHCCGRMRVLSQGGIHACTAAAPVSPPCSRWSPCGAAGGAAAQRMCAATMMPTRRRAWRLSSSSFHQYHHPQVSDDA